MSLICYWYSVWGKQRLNQENGLINSRDCLLLLLAWCLTCWWSLYIMFGWRQKQIRTQCWLVVNKVRWDIVFQVLPCCRTALQFEEAAEHHVVGFLSERVRWPGVFSWRRLSAVMNAAQTNVVWKVRNEGIKRRLKTLPCEFGKLALLRPRCGRYTCEAASRRVWNLPLSPAARQSRPCCRWIRRGQFPGSSLQHRRAGNTMFKNYNAISGTCDARWATRLYFHQCDQCRMSSEM